MIDEILQVAAYVALFVGVALLSYRHLAPAVPRMLRVLRFRRGLRNVDSVLADWSVIYSTPIVDPDVASVHQPRPPLFGPDPEPGTAGAAA